MPSERDRPAKAALRIGDWVVHPLADTMTWGDDPKQPTYIATVPRRGYRLIAAVDTQVTPEPVSIGGQRKGTRPLARIARIAGAVLLLGGLIYGYLLLRDPSPAQAIASTGVAPNTKSIAVLPFLDLTDAMNEEPFADGMTEELIDKLSKSGGLQVSAPTSSFYYKDKQVPLPDIAKSLV